jgi:hypothetical protein
VLTPVTSGGIVLENGQELNPRNNDGTFGEVILDEHVLSPDGDMTTVPAKPPGYRVDRPHVIGDKPKLVEITPDIGLEKIREHPKLP